MLKTAPRSPHRALRRCSFFHPLPQFFPNLWINNGLNEEADKYVCEHIDEELPFEAFDWDVVRR